MNVETARDGDSLRLNSTLEDYPRCRSIPGKWASRPWVPWS
ncbi:MAG: hypothetical protein V8Q27_08785 [Eubacteriales bacterium]